MSEEVPVMLEPVSTLEEGAAAVAWTVAPITSSGIS